MIFYILEDKWTYEQRSTEPDNYNDQTPFQGVDLDQ